MPDTINNLMKNHEPWRLRIQSTRATTTCFMPVFYDETQDVWYGWSHAKGKANSHPSFGVRAGSSPIWGVVSTNMTKLPRGHRVRAHLWYKEQEILGIAIVT